MSVLILWVFTFTRALLNTAFTIPAFFITKLVDVSLLCSQKAATSQGGEKMVDGSFALRHLNQRPGRCKSLSARPDIDCTKRWNKSCKV
jgi:hypothetical protein